jgi:zinc/manganese transport system substrate-binding protein
MRRCARALALCLLCITVALTGCGTPDNGGDRSTVVVTTNILGDVVSQVVPDTADVVVLMRPNSDPHSFGISAQQAALLEQADLIVYNGLGLEEGLLRHVDNARAQGVPTLAVGELADPIGYRDGDQRGRPDPHFWTDPVRMEAVCGHIADAVVEHVASVDPAAVRARAYGYRRQLVELHDWMGRQFDRIRPERRNLVTNHHVFGYLAQRYGLRVVGAVVPSGTTLASPSASDLDSLAGAIRATDTRAVFADSSQPDRLANVLADEAGLRVQVIGLSSESLGEPGSGAASYLEMMRSNTERIVGGLSAA